MHCFGRAISGTCITPRRFSTAGVSLRAALRRSRSSACSSSRAYGAYVSSGRSTISAATTACTRGWRAGFGVYSSRGSDAFVCLTEHSRTLALERFPALAGRPGYIVPHGHYRDAYPRTVSRESARQTLSLPPQGTVLLHFGLMRPYKNVPHLIGTFRAVPRLRAPSSWLSASPTMRLSSAKSATPRTARRTCGSTSAGYRLKKCSSFLLAADLVVLPYRRILNSGVVMLALTFARPVLVPDLGAMRDQQRAFGAEWIRLYRGELTPEELAAACTWATARRDREPDLARRNRAEIARRTCAVYATLMSSPPGEILA